MTFVPLAVIWSTIALSVLAYPSSCSVSGVHKRAEPTAAPASDTLPSWVLDPADPYPSDPSGGIYPNISTFKETVYNEEDGLYSIEWDDAWFPPLNDSDPIIGEIGMQMSRPLIPFGQTDKASTETSDSTAEEDALSTVTARGLSRILRRIAGYKCGNHKYSQSAVAKAYRSMLQHLQRGTQVKGYNQSYYPKRFYPPTGLALPAGPCSSLTACDAHYEFPILQSNRYFTTNANQGPDRVIAVQFIDGSVIQTRFCTVVTHRNLSNNRFRTCTPS